MTECIECGVGLSLTNPLQGEIVDCPECGVELEVRETAPVQLALAPTVEEDWGE